MKNYLLISMIAAASNTFSADTTIKTNVELVESRDVPVQDIYVSAEIPSQGCAYNDRALIDVSKPSGKAMLSVALTAISTGLPVVVRVDGCLGYAPKAVAILLYK